MFEPVRKIRIDGDVAYVPLTRGYEAIVDAEDVPLINWRSWNPLIQKINVYARSKDRNKKTIYMHRIIANAPEEMDVDHINGNTLDNRKSNLRLATTSENSCNSRSHRATKSGIKGVSPSMTGKTWVASIRKDGKTRYLGCFQTKEDAAAAYARASAELQGEFGRLR